MYDAASLEFRCILYFTTFKTYSYITTKTTEVKKKLWMSHKSSKFQIRIL